ANNADGARRHDWAQHRRQNRVFMEPELIVCCFVRDISITVLDPNINPKLFLVYKLQGLRCVTISCTLLSKLAFTIIENGTFEYEITLCHNYIPRTKLIISEKDARNTGFKKSVLDRQDVDNHMLTLKVGVHVMLLRNINQQKGCVRNTHEEDIVKCSEAGFDGKGCATSGVWSSIVGTTNYLHSHSILPKDSLKCCIGNGMTIRFWKDLWLGDEPLCSRYNRLFRLDINENCLLSERYIDGTWCWQWSRPIVSGRTDIMLHSLLAELADVTFSLSPDLWKWNIGSDGSFSVASTRIHLDDFLLPSLASLTTWTLCLPRKVNIFLWRF
ncbi:RNA-directed DNA polymerase, eukaryota, reverse transcriptase zinc-binding domain protein, partial [Tanacetum coccineum]